MLWNCKLWWLPRNFALLESNIQLARRWVTIFPVVIDDDQLKRGLLFGTVCRRNVWDPGDPERSILVPLAGL